MCFSYVKYQPTPDPTWSFEVQKQYMSEYHEKYTELNDKEVIWQLAAWFSSISGIALTALGVIAAAVVAAAIAFSIGSIVIMTGMCLAAGVIGVVGSITGGVWIGSQADQYGHQRSVLDQTLKVDYASRV